MSAPHDCDMCPSTVREEPMDGLSLECGAERIAVWNLLGDTTKPPQSVTKNSPNDRFRMASHWEYFVAKWRLPRPTRRQGLLEPSSSSTRPSHGIRLLPRYASRWASQTSGTSAGCTSAQRVILCCTRHGKKQNQLPSK